MKKKLMVLLILLCIGLQTNLQADWRQDTYDYFCLMRFILVEKIKSLNPFRKKVAVIIASEPAKKVYICKKYRRIYDKHGHRICRRK